MTRDLFAIKAKHAKCPPQTKSDPRSTNDNVCCSEKYIYRNCLDPEFRNEGFKCVEKGKCPDENDLNEKEKIGITVAKKVFIHAGRAKCPRNQICCRMKSKFREDIWTSASSYWDVIK